MSQPRSDADPATPSDDPARSGGSAPPSEHSGARAGAPRIAPGGLRELGPFGWAVNRIGARVTGKRDVHLFATLGHARRLFPAWLAYSGMMMPFGVLDRRTTELVILRVAHLRGSVYERAHHERIGARVGLDDDEITGTTLDPASAGWPDRLEVLLRAVDELVQAKDVSDETWAALSECLTPGELVALVQLVTQYDGLATSLQTLRIQPDRPRRRP